MFKRSSAVLSVVASLGVLLAQPARAEDASADDDQPEGRVSLLEGSATLMVEDAGSPLSVGDDVEEGDRLVTAADSRLEVMFADGSVIRVGPSSELLIAELDFEPDNNTLSARFRLAVGALWAHVEKLSSGGKFEVETEQAVAGVRGTEFRVDSTTTTHSVEVYEGNVAVAPPRVVYVGTPTAALRGEWAQRRWAWHERVAPGRRLVVAGTGRTFGPTQTDAFGTWARGRARPNRAAIFAARAHRRMHWRRWHRRHHWRRRR